jgi:hypothetical protein
LFKHSNIAIFELHSNMTYLRVASVFGDNLIIKS